MKMRVDCYISMNNFGNVLQYQEKHRYKTMSQAIDNILSRYWQIEKTYQQRISKLQDVITDKGDIDRKIEDITKAKVIE